MKSKILKRKIKVKDNTVEVISVNNSEYISLTDLARYADNEEPRLPIRDWMRKKEVISYLGLWEQLNNKNFKGGEFASFKNEAGSNKFKMSPQKWIKTTDAIGIISKSGKYGGGTYAHSEIAFEFASWLSPEFKLYLIQEFERLKSKELCDRKMEWHANRILAKANYLIQIDSIKRYLVPNLTEIQKNYIYAEEADVLNVALFGMTAKEWREQNPNFADKGNIRDYTDLLHLIILNNLENINASLIKSGMPQNERLIILNETAKNQMSLLSNNKNVKELEGRNNAKQLNN